LIRYCISSNYLKFNYSVLKCLCVQFRAETNLLRIETLYHAAIYFNGKPPHRFFIPLQVAVWQFCYQYTIKYSIHKKLSAHFLYFSRKICVYKFYCLLTRVSEKCSCGCSSGSGIMTLLRLWFWLLYRLQQENTVYASNWDYTADFPQINLLLWSSTTLEELLS
jgi:hypothetical protein